MSPSLVRREPSPRPGAPGLRPASALAPSICSSTVSWRPGWGPCGARPELVHEKHAPAALVGLGEHDQVADRIGPEGLESRLKLAFAVLAGDRAEERAHAGVAFVHRLEAGEDERDAERHDAELQDAVRELERVAERVGRRVKRLAQRFLAAAAHVETRAGGAPWRLRLRALRRVDVVGVGGHRDCSLPSDGFAGASPLGKGIPFASTGAPRSSRWNGARVVSPM